MRKVLLFAFLFLFLLVNFTVYKDGQKIKYWIFFDNKETHFLKNVNSSFEYQTKILSKRALERRTKSLPLNRLIDETDLPIKPAYLNQLNELGFKPAARSKWLNGITLYLDKKEKKQVESLNFVKSIEEVKTFRYKVPEPDPVPMKTPKHTTGNRYTYGSSSLQNSMIRTDEIHNLGITGKGVLIGMLDTGFNLAHEAFENLTLIAEYDFINRDDTTSNQTGDPYDQENHGTETLSTIGGFKEGELIGTAFGASFAVAKTEITNREISVEEDYWVEGLEWLDSLGCDIVTSSLGYAFFTDVGYYQREDLDGKTIKVTIAADMAVQKGIVVLNSAGNERYNSWGTLIAPSDGFNVLAIGAVNSERSITNFSSPGPTADGRIKPDVCALGNYVYVAFPGRFSDYFYASGTSYSCPLTAGATALILSAHPSLNPFQVKDLLKNTASKHDNPDSDYGWGVIDAYEALLSYGIVFSNEPDLSIENDKYVLSINAVSKSGFDENSVKLFLSYTEGAFFQEYSMDSGEDNKYSFEFPDFSPGQTLYFYFQAHDRDGNTGYYKGNTLDKSFSLVYGETTIHEPSENNITPHIPEKFKLRQNFPNPFNNSTIICLELPEDAQVELNIFDITGKEIKTLTNKQFNAGVYFFQWDGLNAENVTVSSGIYLAVARTGKSVKAMKMTYIK